MPSATRARPSSDVPFIVRPLSILSLSERNAINVLDAEPGLLAACDVAQQGNQEQYNEQEKENLCNTGGGDGDSREAENGGQQSHNEEDKSPAQHVQSSCLNQRR
jgi:hypothetical protein